jgi:hypothetical protein
LNRVRERNEDDRDRCGGGLGLKRCARNIGGNERDTTVDQIGGQFLVTAETTVVGPAILDRYVAALDKTGFAHTAQQSRHLVSVCLRRPAKKKTDHRHRRLPRPRRERPSRRRPANKSDELASLHCAPQG